MLEAAPNEPALPDQDPADDENATVTDDRESDIRFRLPVGIGYTDLHLGSGQALQSLTYLSVVPTVEFGIPIDDEWTLLPFLGFGGGWLIDEDRGLWILSSGLRAEWQHRLDEPHTVLLRPRLRYEVNLNTSDNVLGDWGVADLALELRRALGETEDEPRIEPGVYAQGFWFWDDLEIEVPNRPAESVRAQAELGLSLGTHEPVTILGIELPRVFVGYRFGDGIETFVVRFGEL